MAEGPNEIIIAGERFALSGDVTVITFEELGSLSFPRKRAEATAATGSDLYGKRRIPKKGELKTLDQLVGNLNNIILHTDTTSDASKCFDVLVSRGLSTHFMIDWDGVIYQGLDPVYTAYHAGDANGQSIGIDLNNILRNLHREPTAPMYKPTHERIAEMSKKEFRRPKSGVMKINNGKVRGYGYTDAQYSALIELLKVLCDTLGIPKEVPFDARGEIVPEVLEDGAGFKGIIAHWHISPDRWDPGPGFDWQRVYYALQGEHNSFPIELEEGKNIATLLEPKKVKAYAEEYYKKNEAMGSGGWYPIGMNQTWHGGIHLPTHKAQPVKAMFDGVVVAGRFGGQPTKLGHNNFLLLKHVVKIPPKNKGGEPKRFEFYSLYMHLLREDFEAVDDDSPGWLKEMMRLDKGKTGDEAEDFEKQPSEEDGEEDENTGEFGEGDDEDEDFEVSDAVDKKTRWLSLGLGLAALKKGQIGLIEYKDAPIKVRAGDVIGRAGQFGPDPDSWENQVHVEVFADPAKDWKEAVNIGIHGRYLVELDDDVGQDLFIENQSVTSLFQSRGSAGSSLVPQRVVSPSDIQAFFTIEGEFLAEKRYLRKLVTRHVSEWSDMVDWVSVLAKGAGWDEKIAEFRKVLRGSAIGKDAITTILPWIWLSKDVAEHIGIEVDAWRGQLDHFHPLQFLIWLTYHSTQRVQSLSRGIGPKRLKRMLEEKKKEDDAKRLQDRGEYGVSFLVEEPEEAEPGPILKRWLQDWDMGEWRRTFLDEDQ